MAESSWVGEAVKELISTPNGQIRLLGGVMCVGPGYYILAQDAQVSNFVYAILGLGAAFIALSAGMAVYAAIIKSKTRVEQRTEPRESFEPSVRLERFAREVLSAPRNREELNRMKFTDYDSLADDQRYGLLMQESAKACVICGIASLVNGNYISKSASEGTVILHR